MKHSARKLCFLYKILVGLVHSLSINLILPKKKWPKTYVINDLRNPWRHCCLMAVDIIWCCSAFWKKWVRSIETKKRWINTKNKNISECKWFSLLLLSNGVVFNTNLVKLCEDNDIDLLYTFWYQFSVTKYMI